MFMAAGGKDDNPMIYGMLFFLLTNSGGDNRRKVADETRSLHDLGTGQHIDFLVFLNAGNQLFQITGCLAAAQGMVEQTEITAKALALFQQHRLKTLLGHGQSHHHSGDATADNKGPCRHRYRLGRQGLELARLGNGHANEILRLVRGRVRLPGMDPGTLVADIDHLDQTGIQTRVFQGLLKKRFMGSGRTGGNDNPVQVVGDNGLFQRFHRILGTGVEGVGVIDHAFHISHRIFHLVHIHHRTDVDAAMADKHAYARFIGVCFLFRIILMDNSLSPLLFQKSGGNAGGSGCLGHGFGDVLWPLEGAGNNHPVPVGGKGLKGLGFGKIIVIKLNTGNIGNAPGVTRRFKTHGQDNQVKGFKLMAPFQGGVGQLQPVLPGGDISHFGADKFDAHGFGPLLGLVKLLALGTDIHVINSDINFRIMLLGHHGLLDRIHAADRGAVAVVTAKVTGADALDKGNSLGMPAIGKTLHLAHEGSGRSGHALEFKTGHHIRMAAVTEFCKRTLINLAKTGRQNDSTDIQLDLFGFLTEINRVALADRNADLAGVMLQVQA